MLNFISWLLLTVAVIYIGFNVICNLVKLWTGCSDNEAITKIHNFVNGKVNYSLAQDCNFVSDIWHNVNNIIGDKRYSELERLSITCIDTQLVSFNYNSGLPYVAITLPYEDNSEKTRLEFTLVNLLKKYLNTHSLNTSVLVDWKVRYDLNLPFLELRYAQTDEELRILKLVLDTEKTNILKQYHPLVDDEEEEVFDD
ncbi:hypothetical protein GKZ28_25545 [Clostridium chromiireducens]|uniref:Uncharacterized protein n=1 Tax=Clostridium chromiireducens TaxID=225345 RepID=A0A964RSK0_9CLOT|nr:hypothetical protein [Clostridium chromiireducens]MVX67020.1 hypothetical protein [Clostridium chromiireducens]